MTPASVVVVLGAGAKAAFICTAIEPAEKFTAWLGL